MVAQGSIGVDAVRAGVERGCDLLGEAFENLRTTNRLAIEPGQRCVGVRVVEEVEVPTIGGDRYDPIARALEELEVLLCRCDAAGKATGKANDGDGGRVRTRGHS